MKHALINDQFGFVVLNGLDELKNLPLLVSSRLLGFFIGLLIFVSSFSLVYLFIYIFVVTQVDASAL
jgi:hypothetical protein